MKKKINLFVNIISYTLILIFFTLMMYYTKSFPDGSDQNMKADIYLIMIIFVFVIKYVLKKIIAKND
jgi:hypothetical protein